MPSTSSSLRTMAAAIVMLAGANHAFAQARPATMTADEFHAAMSRLWEDHITWTRLYIVTATASLPEKDATAERLLRNQVDIGNAIKPYYGDAAGTKLTALLTDHIKIATEIVDAAMKKQADTQAAATTRWGANADEIAMLLAGANPSHWPTAEMKRMMQEHLSLTATELTRHLEKDWAGDAAAYDRVHDQILKMSEMLASGIIHQFPAKFRP
jgi:hypothetical protein